MKKILKPKEKVFNYIIEAKDLLLSLGWSAWNKEVVEVAKMLQLEDLRTK